MHYISQNPGGGGPSNLNQATSVYAFIGTPPHWRRHSRLCWKQGMLSYPNQPITIAS